MSLENIGAHTVKQMNQGNRTEQAHQHNLNQQMDKLLNTHNQIMTKILQQGVTIPKDTFEKVQREAGALKRVFFGLDNQLFEPGMLPPNQDEFVVFYTKTIPVVIPTIFFEPGDNQAEMYAEGITLNLIRSDNWWDYDKHELEFAKFLKVGLVFFSHDNYIKKEHIKDIKIVTDPYLPEKAIVFSMSCNLFALLMFFYTNKQYFHNLNAGIHAFLKFIEKK
jgi:hypothetical protein